MFLFALLLGQAAADSYAAVAATGGCVNAVGCAGFYRAFYATTSPAGSTFGPPSNVTAVAVEAVGVQAATNGVVANAHVDVAGWKFTTPADGTSSLNFYFGYLGASGTFDNSTGIGSISGAFLEVVSAVSLLVAYQDRDGVPGFQWDLTSSAQPFGCALSVGQTFDCFDGGAVDVKNNLTWTPITKTEVNCSLVVAGADPNCKIIYLNTAGFLAGNTTAVINITARAATQPIFINGILHSPLKLKWDVDINVPWWSWTLSNPTANNGFAIIMTHAGKAGAGLATVATAPGSKSLTFTASEHHAAYFGYLETANTDTGGNTTIFTETYTGAAILAYNGNLVAALVLTALKIEIGILQAFGWNAQITIHSFTTTKPNTINWDPENGMQTTSGSALLVPGVALALLALFW